MKLAHLYKYICIIFVVSFLSACASPTKNVTIPLSDKKPTLLVFCNNSDVSCFELGQITPYFDELFGEGTVSIGYIFIDSEQGLRIFDALDLSNIPSYVFFNSEKEEIFRLVGNIDLDQLSENVSDAIQNQLSVLVGWKI